MHKTIEGAIAMEKENYGVKRICLSCNTRFYDFSKSPIVCPACSAVFDPDHLSKKKTKSSYDKNNDIETIKIDEDDDIIADEDDIIVGIDDQEDELSIDDEKA